MARRSPGFPKKRRGTNNPADESPPPTASTPAQSASKTQPPVTVRDVSEWWLQGVSELDVRSRLSSLPDELQDKIIADAARYFALCGGADPEAFDDSDVRRGFCREAYREIYMRALASGDYAAALRAVTAIAAS